MTTKSVTQWLFTLPFIWTFTGLFIYSESDKYFFSLCLLAFLFATITFSFSEIKNNIKSRKIVWVLLFATISCTITKITLGGSSSELRAIISVLLLSVLIPNPVIRNVKKNISLLAFLSSIISLVYVCYQTFILELPRSLWGINAIPYTTLIATVVIILVGDIFLNKSNETKLMAIAGSLVALSALIIGETRGNILALAVALSVLFLVVGIKNKAFIYSCLIAILLVSAVSFHQIQQRYVETKQEILNTAHGKFNNSIGNRIQMWKAGIEISKDPTIFGLGNHHIEVKEKLYKQGKIPKNTVRYKHYHNQYLTAFITKGITGLLALILILGYPVYSYLKNRNNYNLIAILCSTIYAIAGLTDIPLSQPHSIIFYLVILLLLCNSDERNANSV